MHLGCSCIDFADRMRRTLVQSIESKHVGIGIILRSSSASSSGRAYFRKTHHKQKSYQKPKFNPHIVLALNFRESRTKLKKLEEALVIDHVAHALRDIALTAAGSPAGASPRATALEDELRRFGTAMSAYLSSEILILDDFRAPDHQYMCCLV